MTRSYKAHEHAIMAKAKRQSALARAELRGRSEPRVSAAGIVSMAIKIVPEADRKLIDDALAREKCKSL